MKNFTPVALACTALFTLLPLNAALALDGQDFAQKLSDVLGSSGMIVEMGDVSTSGDTVTISGVAITPPGEKKLEMNKPVVFSGVAEAAGGGYTADEAKVAAFVVTAKDIELSVGDIIVEGIIIPADAKTNPLANITLYRHILAGTITGKTKGKDTFSVERMEAFNTLDRSSNVLTGTVAIAGLHVDLGVLQEAGMEELAVAQALGLEVINARVFTESFWNLSTGDLTVRKALIDIENVGKLNMSAKVLGYDEAMLRELYALQSKAAAAGPDATPEEILEQSQAVLNLMSEKLSLSDASIRFDDASITGKIIGMIAAQSGTTADVMAAGFAATIPLLATQFGLPEGIQTMLAEAAAAYLTDPKNIEISIAPSKPVPLKETMVVMTDPSSLISLFNLSIKANQ